MLRECMVGCGEGESSKKKSFKNLLKKTPQQQSRGIRAGFYEVSLV